MTTLTAPEPTAPEQTAPRSPWLSHLLKSLEIYQRADRLLDKPPKGTPLDDLLAVRDIVGPMPSLRDQLRQMQLAALFPGEGRGVTEPALDCAYEYAKRCAGAGAKLDGFKDILLDCLRAIERGIVTRLRAGEWHPELVFTDWFEAHDLGMVEEAKVAPGPLALGPIRCLPEGHPLRELKRHYVSGDKREAHIVLGLVVRNAPRPFFAASAARRWTQAMVLLQDHQLSERPVWNLTDEEVARLKSDQSERQKLPRPNSLQSINYGTGVDLPPTWRELTALVLKTLPRPETCFKLPPDTVTLSDLYAARDRLVNCVPADFIGQEEDPPDTDVANYAAFRLAGKYAGRTRQEEVKDALLSLVVGTDKAIQSATDAGTEWATRRHCALEDEIAELREQLEELRNRG